MSGSIEKVNEGNVVSANHPSLAAIKKGGRKYFCHCNYRKMAGVISLVVASVMFLFASVLASGMFGGGTLAFIAGGLTIASMISFGVAAYCLVQRSPKIKNVIADI